MARVDLPLPLRPRITSDPPETIENETGSMKCSPSFHLACTSRTTNWVSGLLSEVLESFSEVCDSIIVDISSRASRSLPAPNRFGYHKVTDSPDKIDYDKLARVAALMMHIGTALAKRGQGLAASRIETEPQNFRADPKESQRGCERPQGRPLIHLGTAAIGVSPY